MSKGNSNLKVPWLGQVGIVVKDMDSATKYYEETFGIGPWSVFEGDAEFCVDRGSETKFRGKMGLALCGTVQIELIQIIEGKTVHTDFLEEHGEGIHHIGFFVRDLEKRLEAAKNEGIEVLHRGTLNQLGLRIKYAYLDTRKTGGVIIEYIEPRFFGIPFPMRSPLIRLGAKLASKTGK
ncbi:MAG: VOC family protein [Actinomycetota bacterium]|nr:VOC family protein [Actinomycetota bacterium]